MIHRTPWAVLVVGLLGYATWFYLFPQYDPSQDFDLALNRQQAVERARSIGLQAGLEVQNWTAYSRVNRVEKTIYYKHRQPDESGLFLSPVVSQVRLAGPDQEFLNVYLTNDGSLSRFEKRRPTRPEELDEDTQDEDTPDETVRVEPQEVERALRLIAGDVWGQFSQSTEPEVRNGIVTLEFSAPELAGLDRVPLIVIQALGDEVYLVRGDPGFSESFDAVYSDLEDPLEMVLIFVILVTFLGITAGLARFAVGIFDRAAEYRPLMILVAIVVVADFVQFCFGEGWQQAGIENDGILESGLVLFLKYAFTITPVLIATLGTGAIVAEAGSIDKRIHLDLFLGGHPRSRPIGSALLVGGVAAGALLCLPFALIESGIFPTALPVHYDPRHWSAFSPLMAFLRWFPEGPLLSILGVTGLAYPWLTSRLRVVWLRHPLCILILTPFLSLWHFQYSLPAGLVAGFLSALLIDWIYQRSGLLAALSCGIFYSIFHHGLSMAVQSAASLSFNGWMVILLGAMSLGGLGYLSACGKQLDLDAEIRRRVEEAGQRVASRRAEREALLAEFGVARRAQELMLPQATPTVPGVQISAVCTPAKEVGGDLFDFLQLQDGRTGVAVADVSGKGVPAALYMTLAKGLLCSVARSESSTLGLVEKVNAHFHACAQRRVFATLALTVLDPERGVVECARAGHNPVLWWQASRGKTRIINPSGIGIGLAPNRLFSRSLTVEECRLEEGDVLIVYSDGIPEAMNEQKEEYGMERLERAISQMDGSDATQIRNSLLSDVHRFVGETPPSDDITLVVLRFLSGWKSKSSEAN